MSAPYHTQSCNGSQCRCIADHQAWEAECETPTVMEQVWYWGGAALVLLCECLAILSLGALVAVVGFLAAYRPEVISALVDNLLANCF